MNNAISAEMTAEGVSEPTEVLNARYNELEKQWQEMRAKRNNEVTRRLAELDQAHVPDPWIAAGIAGIYGKDPFSAYNQASLVPQAYQKEKYALLNENLSEQEKELAALMKSVQARMAAKSGGSDVPFETKVFGSNLVITDRRNGVTTVVGSDQVPAFQKAVDRYYKTLEQQGGYTPSQMKIKAQEMALDEVKYGNSALQTLPNEPVKGGATSPMTDKPSYQSLDIAEIDKELARPGISSKTRETLLEQKRRLTTQTPPAYSGTPTQDASIQKMANSAGIPVERKVMTASQLAENAKEVTKLQESNQNLKNSNFSLQNMENLSLAVDPKTGKLATSQGPASELITKLGGWVNYFAPESIAALQAGNNAAFFSSMQGQVRSILPAYGSGTAVSNLDLIVGQLAAGSLDNTLQGRLKIIGASKAMNKAMEIVNEAKRQHLSNGGSLADFKMPDEAIVGLAPVRKLINGQTYVRYEPITKDQFIERLKAKNPEQFKKASEKEIAKEWNDFALQKGNYDPGKR